VRQQDAYPTNAGVQLKLRATSSRARPLFNGKISVSDSMPIFYPTVDY